MACTRPSNLKKTKSFKYKVSYRSREYAIDKKIVLEKDNIKSQERARLGEKEKDRGVHSFVFVCLCVSSFRVCDMRSDTSH